MLHSFLEFHLESDRPRLCEDERARRLSPDSKIAAALPVKKRAAPESVACVTNSGVFPQNLLGGLSGKRRLFARFLAPHFFQANEKAETRRNRWSPAGLNPPASWGSRRSQTRLMAVNWRLAEVCIVRDLLRGLDFLAVNQNEATRCATSGHCVILAVAVLILSPTVVQGATYHVRTDGNNGNNGSTDSATGAWATIDWAADHVSAGRRGEGSGGNVFGARHSGREWHIR